MTEKDEDLIIKASKIIHRKENKDEHKDLMRVMTTLDAQEAGPWRSGEDASNWASDYHEMRDQGLDASAASDVANTRESIRISAKVNAALSEQAMQSCILKKVAIYGKTHEQAVLECETGFQADLARYGQKPYESETLSQLNEIERKLNHEIIGFRYNCMDPKAPEEAEKLAREKLGLPKIITITKDEEPKKDSRKLLGNMPNMYQKSSEEILKERRDYDKQN